MNWQSIVILILLAGAFGASVFFTVRRRGKSCGCGGNCACCAQGCEQKK